MPTVTPSIPENLPHSVTIERMTSHMDSLGGSIVRFETVGTMRAFVQTVSQKERQDFQVRNQEVTHKIYYKNTTRLAENNRILFDGRILTVIAVAPATVNLSPLLDRAFCREISNDVDPS